MSVDNKASIEQESKAEHHETALWLQQQANQFKQQEVPHWARDKTFDMPEHIPWYKGVKLAPALSMAMSFAAIFMVLFNVQLEFKEDGMMVSFAASSKQTEQQIRQQLILEFEQKLSDFSRDQQIVMANYFDDIQAKQQEDVTQLASYLISASRQERKEDMGALVNYFKQQRNEDLSLTQQQLNQMLYRLTQHNAGVSGDSANVRRASYQVSGQGSGRASEQLTKQIKQDKSSLELPNEEEK